MAGTVRSRLNHYDVLGLAPTASGDEIARAFARESGVLRPHAFGVLTELCVAYEILRDPIKRRAYDASLGLARGLSLPKLSAGARQTLVAQGPKAADPVERQAPAAAPPPMSQPTFQRIRESQTKPAIPLGPGPDLNVRPEPRIDRADPLPISLDDDLGVEARPIDLRRTGIALGTLVVVACAVGGIAGWWSISGAGEAAQPENVASVSLPPAKGAARPVPEIAPVEATVPTIPAARPERPRPALAAATRIDRAPTVPEPAVEEPQLQQAEADPSLGEQAAVEDATTSTASIPMPLPDRVVARTIERIGYSCGSVASTAPIEGDAAGVFKVTCSSGQSYRASPVNGRYRFKRWGGR